MVTVSKQYFPVFGLYIVQYARRTSWLSLGLGLAFSIFSLGLNTIQLRKKDVLALARVRVSSQYFPVLDCVSYSCASSIILTSILTSSHWFPLVDCGVPVGLNDGSMEP